MEGRAALVIGVVLLLVAALPFSQTAESDDGVGSLVDVILLHDQSRLEEVLVKAQPYTTLKDAYLVAQGVWALGSNISNKKLESNACAFATTKKPTTLEDVFYISSVATMFRNCKYSASSEVKKIVSESLKETVDTKTYYYALTSMANLGMSIDKDTVPTALVEAVESEDTPQSYAYAFLAASGIPDADLSVLFDHIEDIVAQADETPSTLYFDGSLKVTSNVINGIFALADRVKSKPVITEAQATKFANFLVTSKYTSSLADAVYLLTAARTLSANQYVVPIGLNLVSTRPISSSNQDFSIRMTTLMGGVVDGFGVKVKSLEDPNGDINPRTKTMTPGKDKITFSYSMYKDTTGPGVYKVTLSTDSKTASPFVKLATVELPVTVSYQIIVASGQLSLMDKDHGVTTKSISLEYPNTSKESLQADQHSKITMSFILNNKDTSTSITVHQAFVRLTLGMQEIFFVATSNDKKEYSFEMDVAEVAKDFGHLSGTYSMSLVVGDFALANPFSWNVASIELKFPGTPAKKEVDLTYKPKPLIEHLFRVPDKRPPLVVSSTFTVLVIVPLVLLFIVWLIMGANFSNIMNGGIWSLLFHIGLGAILCLYYCFWAQLNMFSTLKYLAAIGLFTFLTGNRMLRNIAKTRQA